MSRAHFLPILALAFCALPAAANDVQVTFTGVVEFNQINSGTLGNVSANDVATLTFHVDAGTFTDNTFFPTRGYDIDQSSFVLDFGGGNQIGLQSPFPAGQTPYFVLRNDDPAVDGFFVSTDINGPIGVPLAQTGAFGQFLDDTSVTYVGSTLTSLDVLDALGTYDFTGLTVFNWTIDDGPFNAMGIVFSQLSIELGAPVVYCTSPGGSIALSGSQSIAADDAVLEATGIPDTFGVFIMGQVQEPMGAGLICMNPAVLCVASPFVRLTQPIEAAGGMDSVQIDFTSGPGAMILPGQTWNFQHWHRALPSDCSFSDAISATFCD